jgi:hypothetical protein
VSALRSVSSSRLHCVNSPAVSCPQHTQSQQDCLWLNGNGVLLYDEPVQGVSHILELTYVHVLNAQETLWEVFN